MSICKTYGKDFHYCSSCGCDGYSEYDYCSSECMCLSEKCKELKYILNSMDNDLKTKLCKLLLEMPESMIEHVINLYV